MSQIPPAYPQHPGAPGQYPMSPRRSGNGMAVASLVLGIVQCIPFLMGLLAVIFGILGIRKANRDPAAGGKGLAIAGLILGVLGIGAWALMGGGIWAFFKASEPSVQLATQFVNDLAGGNVDAAMSKCDPKVSRDDVQKASDRMQPWGAVTNIMVPSRQFKSSGAQTRWELEGFITFAEGGQKPFQCVILEQGDSRKIVDFEIDE
jgi:hypothetical protein